MAVFTGTLTASTDQAGFEAVKATDGIIGTNSRYAASSTAVPQDLTWDFVTAKVPTYYVIGPAIASTGQELTAWEVRGSVSDATFATYDVLDSRSVSAVSTTKRYALANSTAYRYVRLHITATGGDVASVSEFQVGGGTTHKSFENVPDASVTVHSDATTYNMGQIFSSTAAGNVTHLRYYEPSGLAGTVTLRLYGAAGAVLASTTHTAVSGASGWRDVALSSPYTIAVSTEYMAAMRLPGGWYARSGNGGTQGQDLWWGPVLHPAVGNATYEGATTQGRLGFDDAVPSGYFGNSTYAVGVVFVEPSSGPVSVESLTVHGSALSLVLTTGPLLSLESLTVHGSAMVVAGGSGSLLSLESLTVHGSAVALTEGFEAVPDGTTLASRTVHGSTLRLILAPAAVPVVLTEWPVMRQAHVMAALSAASPRYTPHVDYDVETDTIGRLHVWVDGQDVTFLRGSPTIVGECVQSVPLGDDRAVIEFPQIKPWDIPGTGDLAALRPDAPVEVALIRPDDSRTVLFEGFTSSFSDYSGDGRETYTVECEGTLAQAMHEPHDPPLFLEPTDIGVLIARALSKVTNRRYGAIPETVTGILSTNRGSQNQSVWQYVQDLLSVAWSDDGRQWTLRRVAPGTFRLVLKPTTATVHWTVTKGAHGVTVDLIHDESTRRDAVYGRGVDTDGGVWANWFYPFLDEFLPPRYPFNNPATSVSVGTSDGDTDTGNGVTLWQRRMREVGFAVTVDGVMNGNDTAWVKAVQRKRGITADGVLGPQTWTATFDPGPLEVGLTAIRRPLATKPEVETWLYAANGAHSARNPAHDSRIIRHAMPDVFMGTGVRKTTQGYAMADAILTREGTVGAAGRIVLTTDPHEAGASRLDIQVGDNVEVIGHRGGVVVQVAEVAHGSLSSTLTVDERARDALSVEAILERNRQARTSTANRGGTYKSSELDRADMVQYESESKAGTVPRIAVNGNSGLWSVIPIFVSQVGVAKAVLTATSPKAEIVCAIFGRPITANKLASFLPDPLASSDGWYDNVDTLRESYGLMDIWGTPDQPGGYFPKQKTGNPVGPLTGRLEERSGVLYDSQYGGVVWVALFTSRSTWVSGRIFPAVPS